MFFSSSSSLFSFLFLLCLQQHIGANELTFELPDNAQECFHDKLKTGSKFILEFQVVTGGNYDVDVVLKSPSGKVLYQETKKQYDHFEKAVEEDGVYEFCFSNEFSSITHKVIYMDWKVDGDPEHEITAPGPVAQGALTLIETKVNNIHEHMEKSIDYQTHHRLREATGRSRAEDLQERVQIWSVGQFVLIIMVALGTVLLLRSFFTDRRTSSSMTWNR